MVADARFLPNPYWDETLRPLTGRDERVSADVLGRPGAREFVASYEELIRIVADGYLREGKRYVTVAVGCTGGKHRSVAIAEELTARLRATGPRCHLPASRPGPRVSRPRLPAAQLGSSGRRRVVALGGGHGLAATLQALRQVTDELAVVGVADDGGSGGRLRDEFGVLPPGDLRMALAALCGDDSWGRTWEQVIQHRFGGEGQLGGHSVGNLLITALWEQTGDPVTGLDWVGALLQAQGRVLPCSGCR